MNATRFSTHYFASKEDIPFDIQKYSRLKFGSDIVAKEFGYEMADRVFSEHAAFLLANKCVVMASPYHFVENASQRMTKHFIDRINQLLVTVQGDYVETSVIHRHVTYTSDYGFLSAEKRKALLKNDRFYLNKKYVKGKSLIFIDDVRSSGVHENKLVEMLKTDKLDNPTMFLYYAQLKGENTSPDIEAYLNFAGMKNLSDLAQIMAEPNHQMIVRPIKYLMKLPEVDFNYFVQQNLETEQVVDLYHKVLGNGYYKIPDYQDNFKFLTGLVSLINQTHLVLS